jgi:hypothetical protein
MLGSWLELVDPGRCMGRCWLELELNDSWAEGCGIYPSVALSTRPDLYRVRGVIFCKPHDGRVPRVRGPPN